MVKASSSKEFSSQRKSHELKTTFKVFKNTKITIIIMYIYVNTISQRAGWPNIDHPWPARDRSCPRVAHTRETLETLEILETLEQSRNTRCRGTIGSYNTRWRTELLMERTIGTICLRGNEWSSWIRSWRSFYRFIFKPFPLYDCSQAFKDSSFLEKGCDIVTSGSSAGKPIVQSPHSTEKVEANWNISISPKTSALIWRCPCHCIGCSFENTKRLLGSRSRCLISNDLKQIGHKIKDTPTDSKHPTPAAVW